MAHSKGFASKVTSKPVMPGETGTPASRARSHDKDTIVRCGLAGIAAIAEPGLRENAPFRDNSH
jgi:hypothetical protein